MEFVKEGQTVSVVLAADITVGQGKVFGDKVFVAASSGKTGETIEFYTKGVWKGASTGTILQGEDVKFDDATQVWSKSGTGEAIHGYAHLEPVSNVIQVCIG